MVDLNDGLGGLCEHLSNRLTLNTSVGVHSDNANESGHESSFDHGSASDLETASTATGTHCSSATVTPVEDKFSNPPMEPTSKIRNCSRIASDNQGSYDIVEIRGGLGEQNYKKTGQREEPVAAMQKGNKAQNPDEVLLSDSESDGEIVDQISGSTLKQPSAITAESNASDSDNISSSRNGAQLDSKGEVRMKSSSSSPLECTPCPPQIPTGDDLVLDHLPKRSEESHTTMKPPFLAPLEEKPVLPAAFGMQSNENDGPNGAMKPLASNLGSGLGSSKHAQAAPMGPATRHISVPAFGAPLPFQPPRQEYYGQRSHANSYQSRDYHRDQAAREFVQLQKAREELRIERKAHHLTRTTLEAETHKTNEAAMASMLTDVFRKYREVEKIGLEQTKTGIMLTRREKLMEVNESFLAEGQRLFYRKREGQDHISDADLIFVQAREEGFILGKAEANEAAAEIKHQERLNTLLQEETDLRQNMWVSQNMEALKAQVRCELEEDTKEQIDTASYQKGHADGMKNGEEAGRKKGFLEGFRAASESFAYVAALQHGIELPNSNVRMPAQIPIAAPLPHGEMENGVGSLPHQEVLHGQDVPSVQVPADLFNTTTSDKGYKKLQRPKVSMSTPTLTQELNGHVPDYHNGHEILANRNPVTTNGHTNGMVRQSEDVVFVNHPSREVNSHGSTDKCVGDDKGHSLTNGSTAILRDHAPTNGFAVSHTGSPVRRGRGRFQDVPQESSTATLSYEDMSSTPSARDPAGVRFAPRGPLVNPVDGRVQKSYEDLEDDSLGGEVREVGALGVNTASKPTTNGNSNVQLAPEKTVVDLMDL